MSSTITWVIDWMQVSTIPVEGHSGVVITAGWRCNGAQTEGSGEMAYIYTATSCGSCSFPMPEGSFTPYADLTQDQVLGWCWANGVNKTEIEASVQQQIDNQVNPPVIQPPLPWTGA